MKLRYFNKKDGWDQYWDMLEKYKDLPEEDLVTKAMYSADKLTSRRKVLGNLMIIRSFLFIREYNRYLKENKII